MPQHTPRLIDVRQLPEFAAGHIEGSELVPLNTLSASAATWDRSTPLTLICKTGRRAQQAHDTLSALGFHHLTILPGGIDAWHSSGKPLETLARRPWSMERQVRIVAGSLVLLTLLLAATLSRYILFATAFVGAGLVFAGVSDICMMATVLGMLPWNKQSSRTTSSPQRSQA
jgi:rhodanese-related sulfurtransferase